MRKYADIITEAEMSEAANPQQIAQALSTKLKPEEQQAMVAMAEKIVGKPVSQITAQDAAKFGPQFEKALAGGLAEEQLTEINWKAAWDTAKTKLGALGFLGALGAGTAYAAASGDYSSAGTVGGALLMSLGMLGSGISDLGQEYQAQKQLQTTTDPEQKQQLQRKISNLNR